MFPKLFKDQVFTKTLIKIALPLTGQYAINSSLTLVDMLMIGQLGETAVASVGLSNQFYFLLYCLFFGIGSGASIFTAQFWGKKDIKSIHKVLGICLSGSLISSGILTLLAFFLPQVILGIYSNDPAVIAVGSRFLRVLSLGFVVNSFTVCYAGVLRSTGEVRIPMVASIVALSLNTLLNYLLIFGNFGFPAMGIEGSALATSIARFVEFGILISLVYRTRTPAAAPIKELFSFDRTLVRKVVKVSLPTVGDELLWSVGMSAYNAVYARISTEAVASVNISATIENFAYVLFIALADASTIMIGNQIGAGDSEKAMQYSRRFLVISSISSILIGAGLFAGAPYFIKLYNLSPESQFFALNILRFAGLVLWVRVANILLFAGILRAGGDTRFTMFTGTAIMWGVGVPLALLGAFVFHLPVHWVYLLVVSEEFIKFFVVLKRFYSRKWINNLTLAT